MITLKQLQRLWTFKSICKRRRKIKTTCNLLKINKVLKTKMQVLYKLIRMGRTRIMTTSSTIKLMILSTKSTMTPWRKKTNQCFWSLNTLRSKMCSTGTRTLRLSFLWLIWRTSRRKQPMLTSAKATNKTLWNIILALAATRIRAQEVNNGFHAKLLKLICQTWTRATSKTLTIWNWSTTA